MRRVAEMIEHRRVLDGAATVVAHGLQETLHAHHTRVPPKQHKPPLFRLVRRRRLLGMVFGRRDLVERHHEGIARARVVAVIVLGDAAEVQHG